MTATKGQPAGISDLSEHEAVETETPESADSYLLGADSDVTPTLSIVMPTLNEEEGIGECIAQAKSALAELGVYGEILVSDSSDDRTPDIARERGAIVVEPDKPGYGYAYRYAFERARGEYIAIGDADTTYDFEELPKLYEKVVLGDADMAMGSRLAGDIQPGAMPKLHQYVGNPLLTKFLNLFYDAGVSDAHSGMRVVTREALDQMELRTLGMEFASEMIMEAGARDLTIAEVPITYHERKGEATLNSFRDGWRHVRFMLVNAPSYLFTVPGLLMSALGVAVMALAYFQVGVGQTSFGIHSLVAGSLFAIVGHQVASLGVFSTIVNEPIQEPQTGLATWITENFQLEHGATLGASLSGAGVLYAALAVSRWIQSGYTSLPALREDVVAFTAIVLGIQIVFWSFFMSTIIE
jgi:hypothetical protein